MYKGHVCSYQLNSFNSAFTAEFLAMYQGLLYIHHQPWVSPSLHELTQCPPEYLQLHTWSLSQCGNPVPDLKYICHLGKSIVFFWIPGHTGLPGNEAAASHGILAPEQVLSAVTIMLVSITQLHLLDKTNGLRWTASCGHWSHLSRCGNPLASSGKRKSCLHTFQIGHIYLRHSHLLRRDPAPVCLHCGLSHTVSHIHLECPQ
jgi:hypothetical protein